MSIMDWAAWCVIIGLSGIAIGGLLLWAYGESVQLWIARKVENDHGAMAARRRFTGVLTYSMVMIVLGFGLLVQGTLYILKP